LSDFAVKVFQVHGLLTAAGDALARPAGQTSARWLVMAAIEDAPATVAQVARRLRLARQSVQRVANLLVRDGLADFHDNPSDRRTSLLALSPRGLDVLRAIQDRQRAWADDLGGRFGTRRLEQGTAILERIQQELAKGGF
jgi:DNA-binding MarR family transcriptional regulator